MANVGEPFFDEYCERCKGVFVPLPKTGRCKCGNKAVFKWMIYRASDAEVELCTKEEIAAAKKAMM